LIGFSNLEKRQPTAAYILFLIKSAVILQSFWISKSVFTNF